MVATGLSETPAAYRAKLLAQDDVQIDAWGLMQLFRERYPQAMTLATSELAGPLGGWWQRHRIRRQTQRLGISAVLPRPLQPPAVSQWLDML